LIAYAPVGRVADQTVHLNGDLQHALPPVAELLREISERTTPVSVAAPASDDGVEAPTSSLGGLNPHLGAKPPASSLGGAPRLKTPVPATSPPPRPPEPAGARPASSPIDSPPRPDRPPPSSLGGKPPRSSLDGDPPGSS
jgi:hypothetical protein